MASNALAPYAASMIGQQFGHGENRNEAAQLLSHAVLGAVLAQVNGGSAAAGAVSAAGAEAASNYIAKELYPYAVTPNGDIDASLLTPEQRQNLSSLGAAVGAIGGGLVGNSLYNAAVGSQVGQNAVVNNSEKVDALRSWVKDKLSWLSKDELKNNLDVIQNVVAKTASNAIDGAIGTADWANDNLNAVVYCIGLSPSLCQSARNTVDPKNREIIDAIAASVDPVTYKVIAQKFSDAAAGNLQAREEVGLLIGSIIQRKVKTSEITTIARVEKILPQANSWEQARNQALNLVGNLGEGSRPVLGRLPSSAGNGKIIGRQSADGKVGWRLDYDPVKGTHINTWDWRNGKGVEGSKMVIPFKGNEDLYRALLKQLNR